MRSFDEHSVEVLLTWPSDGVRLFESMMPLGLASLAGMLDSRGFRVRILDFNHYTRDFRQDLLLWKPRIVGIGGTTATRKGSFLTARLVKEILPDCVVVFGGPHATFAFEDTLNHVPQVDYCLRGEAEWSLLRLCEILLRGSDAALHQIPGLVWRDAQGVRTNSPERIQDLSTLPMPARNLFSRAYRMKIDHTEIDADFIVTSRGCPVICDFCSASRMFPGGVRLRPMEHVRQEVQWIRAHRPEVHGLKVFDSTFTANHDHVRAFCGLMREFNLKWECEVRADTVDFALLQEMRDSGCVFVSIGFETTDAELLRRMGKRITKEQVDQVLVWCRNLGIIAKVFFTFGHLGQNFSQCMRDLKYLRANRDRIGFYATTVGIRVYPGTVLEYRARKAGIIPPDFSWAKFKAPMRNWWVLEPADVMILETPAFRLPMLGVVLFRLLLQGTALSPRYVVKMIPQNFALLLAHLRQQVRYTQHRIQRWRVGLGSAT